MAQPVFDEHPLEEYFRQTGEVVEDMPGAHIDTPDIGEGEQPDVVPVAFVLPGFLSRGVQALNSFLASTSSDDQFAERFKYDVISSSLLSTTLSPTPRASVIPGRLPDETSEHFRDSSTAEHSETANNDEQLSQLDLMPWPTALVSVAIVALSAEYYFVALLLLTVAAIIGQASRSQASKLQGVTLTMSTLKELISAGNVWDSAINQAMAIIEKEERRPSSFYGPTSPHSPFSPLRVALQSSLHTTQNQCDNVRQLLTALTSPTQASQLAEMYAPSSPTMPSYLRLDHPRPLSDPIAQWRKRTTSLPHESPFSKRSTWNGSYMTLARASKSPSSTQRREKRRSDLSALFHISAPPKFPSMSAPTSPLYGGKLSNVKEEVDMSDEEDDNPRESIHELSEQYFGMAALDLRRKRQSAGMDSIRYSRPPSYSSQPGVPLQASISMPSPGLSFSSASRFTLPQTTRNPLSLSALRLALHGAMSAKRYCCSHLLALRFEDDEDDTYWEDVRSILALLTSTFSDASARLTEALDQSEKKRIRDQRPSSPDARPRRSSMNMQEIVGFAPMPSHVNRFATHVDAISTALDDARTHLEQCVESLRDLLQQNDTSDPFIDHTTTPSVPASPAAVIPTDSPTLQAYDRLRKELGLALRECERGRENLLNTISPPNPSSTQLTEGDDEVDAAPSLVPDVATSDGGNSATSSYPSAVLPPPDSTVGLGLDALLDDATEHLLMSASSQHLPPPGVDQVYEADSGAVGAFTRERSKLSREERIKLAKERREKRESQGSARGHTPAHSRDPSESTSSPTAPKWGPGGEVVQELKDVIWKVGEKKRKLAEQQHHVKRGSLDVVSPDGIPISSSNPSVDGSADTEKPLAAVITTAADLNGPAGGSTKAPLDTLRTSAGSLSSVPHSALIVEGEVCEDLS